VIAELAFRESVGVKMGDHLHLLSAIKPATMEGARQSRFEGAETPASGSGNAGLNGGVTAGE
jgi:hypothetical protein